MTKRLDLTGQRYGRLVAQTYVGNMKWLCKCDCGATSIVATAALRSGNTKSCGCLKQDLIKARNFIDRQGKRFGRLVVQKYLGKSKWLCVCDCGNETIVSSYSLDSGETRSCGCYQRSRASKTQFLHGKTDERLYIVWKGMKQRCLNPNYKEFHLYGGRGINICPEWKSDYMAFRDWAYANGYDENAPRGKCTIDRIDTNGNYEPSNCRWVDMRTQSNNKRKGIAKNPKKRRPVDLIDENGLVIKHYESMTDAHNDTGCRISSIQAVCNGTIKTSLGRRWCYAESKDIQP